MAKDVVYGGLKAEDGARAPWVSTRVMLESVKTAAEGAEARLLQQRQADRDRLLATAAGSQQALVN